MSLPGGPPEIWACVECDRRDQSHFSQLQKAIHMEDTNIFKGVGGWNAETRTIKGDKRYLILTRYNSFSKSINSTSYEISSHFEGMDTLTSPASLARLNERSTEKRVRDVHAQGLAVFNSQSVTA